MSLSQFFGNQGYLIRRQHDFAQYGATYSVDPGSAAATYDSQYIPSEANHFNGPNIAGFRNDDFGRLSRAADSELEQAKRAPMFAEMQAIWTEELPNIGLYARLTIEVHKTSLQNWEASGGTTVPTQRIAAMYFK